MDLSSKNVGWNNATLTLLGRTITGLRGWEVKKTNEKEHVYASWGKPIDIGTGNQKVEGNIKLLKYELDLLNEAALAAGYFDITEVPHAAITLTIEFKQTAVEKIRRIAVIGIGFTESGVSAEQGAKMLEVTLPFLAMDVVFS